MRSSNALVGLILLLELVLLSGYAAYAAIVGGSAWDCLQSGLDGHRQTVLVVGLVNILLFVLFLTTGFRSLGKGDQFLSFDSDGGSVHISLKAVSDFVSHVGDEFAAILGLKPNIRVEGNQLEMDLDLKLKAGAQVPELCQLLQKRIRQTIEENLGFTDIRYIKVKVRDIVAPTPERSDAGTTQAG